MSVFTMVALLGCSGRDPAVGAGSGDAGSGDAGSGDAGSGDAGVGGRGSDGGVVGSTPGADGGGGADANNVNWPVMPNDASGPTATNGVSLTISSTVRGTGYDGLYAPAGSQFFVVGVSLGNTGRGALISANPIFFSLTTTQSLVVTASPWGSSGACTASVSVASGGTLSCFVVFTLTSGETPSAVLYNDLQGDKASALVPATVSPTPTVCSSVMAWMRSAAPNSPCSSCVAYAASASCASSVTGYRQTCQIGANTCSTCSSSGDFCACEPSCDSAACQSLFTEQNQCIFNQCSAQCP